MASESETAGKYHNNACGDKNDEYSNIIRYHCWNFQFPKFPDVMRAQHCKAFPLSEVTVLLEQEI